MSDTASNGTGIYAPANYLALTETATAPADADTALTGELAAASGGLIRAQAAFTYTSGANTYTLTKTFTMNANDGASRTIQKLGVFNAATAGIMVFSSAVPNPPAMVPGDQLAVTETVSLV